MTTSDVLYTWLAPFQRTVEARCPKCASPDLHWEWHPTIVIGGHCADAHANALLEAPEGAELPVEVEHLCRGCLACCYAWCEETADA